MSRKYIFKIEDSPHGLRIGIFEEADGLVYRIGSYYPKEQYLSLSFSGSIEKLIELLKGLIKFVKERRLK